MDETATATEDFLEYGDGNFIVKLGPIVKDVIDEGRRDVNNLAV